MKEKTFGAFDFLVLVFLNVGYFYKRGVTSMDGQREPEFYTLPVGFVRSHHDKRYSWQKISLRHLPLEEVEEYKNEKGFELIAKELGVPYPSREKLRS